LMGDDVDKKDHIVPLRRPQDRDTFRSWALILAALPSHCRVRGIPHGIV
jgi:hypothetical protein